MGPIAYEGQCCMVSLYNSRTPMELTVNALRQCLLVFLMRKPKSKTLLPFPSVPALNAFVLLKKKKKPVPGFPFSLSLVKNVRGAGSAKPRSVPDLDRLLILY